jgi:hypothetical protein
MILMHEVCWSSYNNQLLVKNFNNVNFNPSPFSLKGFRQDPEKLPQF